jgi:glutamine---fructose-6-phosphate transaminase (isomerizing)
MSRMLDEAREAPEAVARQLREDRERWRAFGERLRAQPPASLLTIARGSSDHAAHYAAYLIMARLGRLVTSMPMSLVTLYQSQIRCDGLASLAFSQSGQSPDLIGPTEYFRQCGALTCAFVNDAGSPLARAAEWLFPLHAGQEASVAATKSFIAQLVAGARLAAAWQDDATLASALEQLPAAMEQACNTDWSPAVEALRDADRLFVVMPTACSWWDAASACPSRWRPR